MIYEAAKTLSVTVSIDAIRLARTAEGKLNLNLFVAINIRGEILSD